MSFIFSKARMAGNPELERQWGDVQDLRAYFAANELDFSKKFGNSRTGGSLLTVNAARTLDNVWLDFDSQLTTLAREPESELLRDLAPLARSVNIGKIVSEYRRSNGAFSAQSSIDGQHKKPMDRGSFDFDGTLILVHTSQVGRTWRELEGERSEGFDGLLEDQAGAVIEVNDQSARYMINGDVSKVYKGYKGHGIKTSANVIAVDLDTGGSGITAVDLTSPTLTLEEANNFFIQAIAAFRNTNAAFGRVKWYVSSAIIQNLSRLGGVVGSTRSIISILLDNPDLAGIVYDPNFTGNELAGVILDQRYVKPIVGMPMTTTPMNRVTPMDDFQSLIWTATGLQIKADSAGNGKGVMYASGN